MIKPNIARDISIQQKLPDLFRTAPVEVVDELIASVYQRFGPTVVAEILRDCSPSLVWTANALQRLFLFEQPNDTTVVDPDIPSLNTTPGSRVVPLDPAVLAKINSSNIAPDSRWSVTNAGFVLRTITDNWSTTKIHHLLQLLVAEQEHNSIARSTNNKEGSPRNWLVQHLNPDQRGDLVGHAVGHRPAAQVAAITFSILTECPEFWNDSKLLVKYLTLRDVQLQKAEEKAIQNKKGGSHVTITASPKLLVEQLIREHGKAELDREFKQTLEEATDLIAGSLRSVFERGTWSNEEYTFYLQTLFRKYSFFLEENFPILYDDEKQKLFFGLSIHKMGKTARRGDEVEFLDFLLHRMTDHGNTDFRIGIIEMVNEWQNAGREPTLKNFLIDFWNLMKPKY